MIPEMAAAYVVSMVPNATLTGLHLYLYNRKLRSTKMRQLQKNLGQIDLYWAESEATISYLNPLSLAKDAGKYRRSALILGGICLLLSWFGLMIQLIVMVSLRYLAVSRFELRIFSSEISERDLDAQVVRNQIEELRGLYPTAVAQLGTKS